MDEGNGTNEIIDFRTRIPQELFPDLPLKMNNITQYDAVLDIKNKYREISTESLLALMDRNNVTHAIIHAEYEYGDIADELNKIVVELVEKYPNRFSGVGTVSQDEFSIKRALKQVDECVEMGMLGLSLQPAFFGMEINDSRLYPVYAKAMERNLFVAVHTGVNYAVDRPIKGERPVLLDEVACDFPDLTIIASHGGWPWVPEMVAVARKHPRVFVEFGGLAPKYIGAPGSGWETMYRFMNSVLSSQVLMATDWPTMAHDRVVKEWQDLDLKPAVKAAVMGGNAKKLIEHHRASR